MTFFAIAIPALMGLFGLAITAVGLSDTNSASHDESPEMIGAMLIAGAITFALLVSPHWH
jgi:hypothetical protein